MKGVGGGGLSPGLWPGPAWPAHTACVRFTLLLQRVHEAVQVVLRVVLLLVPQLSQTVQHRLHGGLSRARLRLLALRTLLILKAQQVQQNGI